MKTETIFMETTKVSSERTVAEIQKIMSRYGASKILLEYAGGEVEAVSFIYKVGGLELPFRLPCRWPAMFEVLKKRRRGYLYDNDRRELEAKAKRVAWRQILRWVEAQMALVETRMVKMEEVFLPYIQANATQTVYEKYAADGFAAIEYKPAPAAAANGQVEIME